MPDIARLFSKSIARSKSSLTGRFASETLRFRLAVSLGFLIVAVGFLVLGPGARFGVAQSIWGILGLPEGGAESPSYAANYGSPAGDDGYRHARRHRSRTASRRDHDRDRVKKHLAATQPMGLGRKSVCVRLCDGFAFPVGNYYGEGDRAVHEAACRSECPGARTALYVLPIGSDNLAEAIQAKTGQTYSKASYAFHYTTFFDETCSCHPQEGATRSLLRDFTLRRGDAVMTSAGMKIFHGGTGYPFKPKAFVALNKSRDIRQADRNSLRAIERASLSTPTVVASKKSPAPATVSRNSTKGLEHQARN